MSRRVSLMICLLTLTVSAGQACALGLPAGGAGSEDADRPATSQAALVWDYVQLGQAQVVDQDAGPDQGPIGGAWSAAPTPARQTSLAVIRAAYEADEPGGPAQACLGSRLHPSLPVTNPNGGTPSVRDNRVPPDAVHPVPRDPAAPPRERLVGAQQVPKRQASPTDVFHPPRG
jgi:hypothetical protein